MKFGNIFEIKRFAVHDGDGIRTTVFFKGCSLKCLWCHNPEGIECKAQLACFKNKCVMCGECADVCENKVHIIKNGEHIINSEKCVVCGNCVAVCPRDALAIYGKRYTIDELISILLADKAFYDNSGGGVTLSGGECLLQSDFCAELLSLLKENGIHTAVDTCGFVPRERIEYVMKYTDIFLYDIKAIDRDTHIRCTGQSNDIILENLQYIDLCGKATEIRIPFVPQYNDGEIEKIGSFLKTLKNVSAVRILPYHNLAGSKYASLNMKNTLPSVLPNDEEIETARSVLRAMGLYVKN